MKKRTLILSSFVFLLSAATFGQESNISSTRLTKESTKSKTTGSNHTKKNDSNKLSQNSSNTIESIDREILMLENVLIINKDDETFNTDAVNQRITELNERRKNLIK